MNPVSSSRRRFLIGLAGAAALLPLMGTTQASAAAAPVKLTESDPSAKALGYVENAAKLDPAKEAMFKKGSKCESCALYQTAQASGGHAPCAAFPGKVVNANGWCRAYAAKA